MPRYRTSPGSDSPVDTPAPAGVEGGSSPVVLTTAALQVGGIARSVNVEAAAQALDTTGFGALATGEFDAVLG